MRKHQRNLFQSFKIVLFLTVINALIIGIGTGTIFNVVMAGSDEDMAKLDQLRREASTMNTNESRSLAATLAESINIGKSVIRYEPIPTSGNCIAKYDGDGQLGGYVVRYQESSKVEYERLANLVHELTHCYVHKKYDRFFYNYSNVAKPLDKALITEFGFLSNEEALQLKMFKDPKNKIAVDTLSKNLKKLKSFVPSNWDKKTVFITKIDYGSQSPHKEYDTVINQMMVFCHYLECTKQPKFYSYLRALADDARDRRMTGKPVSAEVPVPK